MIPQPQTTEGFTYGDTVFGYALHQSQQLQLTAGLRLQTTPQSVTIGDQSYFELIQNASHDEPSVFIHINYMDWNFGTYYSEESGHQASALNIPLLSTDQHWLSLSVADIEGNDALNVASITELSLEYHYKTTSYETSSSLSMAQQAHSSETRLNNGMLT